MSLKLNCDEIKKSENNLVKYLIKYVSLDQKGTCYIEEPINYNKGNKKMIESLYRTSFKFLETIDDYTCVVEIPSGFMNLSSATFALKLESDNLYIVGYAKEGLIRQNIYDKALNKIKAVLENDKVSF